MVETIRGAGPRDDCQARDTIYLLTQNKVLKACGTQTRVDLLRSSSTLVVSRNEFVFAKGETSDACYVVLSGQIGVGAYSLDGRHCVIADFRPGDMFGEIAALDGGPRTADAIALEDTRLLVIRRRVFRDFLAQHSDASLGLLQIIGRRLRNTMARLDQRRCLSFTERLAHQLLALSQPRDGAPGDCVPCCALSQARLADIVGASRQSVNKQLRIWSDDGVIRLSRGAVRILDEHCLRRIAGLAD